MDEKAPLLRPLVRRNNGSPRGPEIFLSLLVVAGLVFLGFTVHDSAGPGQKIYNVESSQAAGAAEFSWASIQPSRTLEWHACFDSGYDCARLDLPRDWLEPNDEDRVVLAIARLRANDTNDYRGPVFFNPGGPGGSGIWALRDHGKQLQTIVGTNHDIITFDPRGVGASVPRIECWDTVEKRHDWALQETPVIDSHDGVLYDVWARASAFSMACEQSHKDTGLLEHIGTASHARDMLEILHQVGEDKLQYWGFSYGTILGGTFAALYPEKVGRLVSDGNVDYEEWFNSAHVNAVRDADAVMDAFYDLCHQAGPETCAFYASSPAEIKERHKAILEQLRVQPLIYMPPEQGLGSALPEVVTYSKIRQLAATSLYRPNYYFPHLAKILAGLDRGDGEPYFSFITRYGLPFSDVCSAEYVPPEVPLSTGDEGSDDAFPTILCADGEPLGEDPRAFEDHVRDMANISWSSGVIVIKDRVACAGRTVRPKWRFSGPFNAKTSFPILFIANMADNITPLISARNNSAGFEDSVVLIQNSYGHTSLAAPSLCTAKAVRQYFQDGILPPDGATCDPEILPFDLPGHAVAMAGSHDDNDDDRALVAASRELSLRAGWGLDKGERSVA
ncbi:alpha/beta-hydrolase [Cryphonectria parasitica EP155]|uniref:Alpha/beta-hydrolase n=1 Tax=Cryphonectria parasitica (strain ATCC 38755 / EP155) TaxID=660469 RepID=A0A9P5CNJ1_CRYP1|nr:alpha/beta-hydrolase [Cryphonectria parasitica EP155]KAF3764181.1 alpha/beta-hydrolase [Cryphonectria parasitica EP155]